MRFPEDQIKAAILHPEECARERAARYFSDSHSPDPTIMPLIIQAIETFGRENAQALAGPAMQLRQTAETIGWLIDELNSEPDAKLFNYHFNLSQILDAADPALLLPREADILAARNFYQGFHEPLSERLRMLDWDQDRCWQELEAFCEAGKDKTYTNEVDLSYANQIVEALARFGRASEERVLAILSEKIEDFRGHPMRWLESLTLRLAGLAHLESSIPLLIAKLLEDGGDLSNEAASEALARIGTPAVIEAVAHAFPTAKYAFRLYSIRTLEETHSELAIETSLRLLAREPEYSIRVQLAYAALSHFASDAIEPARQLLIGRRIDFDNMDLRSLLVETCTITGERFPEYQQWLEELRKEYARTNRLLHYAAGMSTEEFENALMDLEREVSLPPPKPRATPPLWQHRQPLPPARTGKQKIGRNDPCPCGSGKKFKNCCMRKAGSD